MSTHKPPSSRLAMPDPRPIFAGLGLIVLGGIMIAMRTEQWRDLGWALVVVGGCTVGWWVSQARRVAVYRRELDREAERKAALNVTRRQKEEEERAQREADKKTKEDQAVRLREQRAEESRRRKEAEEVAARERAVEEGRINIEITRLKGLGPDSLREEVAGRMEGRGYRTLPQNEELSGLKLLRTDGGAEAVCRIVSGHSGRAADVRDLEAWRRDVGAVEAYLVCLNGFAPDAVRAAQGKPITLIESHLLASWDKASTEADIRA